jgi:hypothetical protein
MKTVIVIYSNQFVADNSAINKMKHYAFKTHEELKVNDVIKSSIYDTNIQVIKVLEEDFEFYNMSTSELSNTYTSTAQRQIRELRLDNKEQDIVYFTKLN